MKTAIKEREKDHGIKKRLMGVLLNAPRNPIQRISEYEGIGFRNRIDRNSLSRDMVMDVRHITSSIRHHLDNIKDQGDDRGAKWLLGLIPCENQL
eukprot:scaffold2204_cov166-Amphora_coffeaeformis.AAC.20